MKNKKFWQIRNEADSDSAELLLYGEIANETWYGDEVTPRQFAEDIRSMAGKPLTLRINSPGGDVFAAQAIYNQLKAYEGSITAYIDGMAASAATIITCAADKVIMPDNAIFMIHNPMVGVCSYLNENQLKDIANQLSTVKQTIINVYLKKCTDMAENKLKKMMDNETWMTAQEAMDYGFVDELADGVKIENSISNGVVIVNNMTCNLQRFHNPRQLEEIINRHGKDDKNMNESKLMSLLQDIKDAVTGKNKNSETEPDPVAVERQRMLDLDNLRNGNELINKIVEIAKKNGNTAEEIKEYVDAAKAEAEKPAQPAKDKGLEEIKNLIKDQLTSGSNGVAPQNSDGVPKNNKALEIDNLVKAMQKVRGE